MGLLNGMMGNASRIDPRAAAQEYGRDRPQVEYHTLPYRSITHFGVETAGTFDLDAELKIWMSGGQAPIIKQFGKGVDVYEVQALLSTYVAH